MDKILIASVLLGQLFGMSLGAQDRNMPRFNQIFEADYRFIKAFKTLRRSYQVQHRDNHKLVSSLKAEYYNFIKKDAVEKKALLDNQQASDHEVLETKHKKVHARSKDERQATEVDAQAGYYYDYYSYYDDDASSDDDSEEFKSKDRHFTTMDTKKKEKKSHHSSKDSMKTKRDLGADDDGYYYDNYYYSSPFDDDYVPQNDTSSLQGYLSYQFYSELGCNGIPTYTSGSNIKNCMPYMDWSYRITFSDPNCFDLRIVFYEDTDCSDFVGSTRLTGYTECVNRKDDSYMSSSQLFCSTEANLPIYQPSVVISYYGNDTSCSNEVLEFGATAIDVCLKDYTYFYRNYTVPGNTSFVETCDSNQYNVTTYLFDNQCFGNGTTNNFPLSCFDVGTPSKEKSHSSANFYYDMSTISSQQSGSLRGGQFISSNSKIDEVSKAIKTTTVSDSSDSAQSYTKLCSPYATSATMNADVNSPECVFSMCGEQQVVINNCARETCLGDTFIRLFNAAGVEVASNDDGCSLCSNMIYQSPPDYSCQNFTLREGCYDMTTCGGIFNITVGPIPVNSSYTPTNDDDQDPYKYGFAQSSCVKTVSIRPTMMPVLPPTYSPSNIPTKRPSRTPTYLPTISNDAVEFSVIQVIYGISTTQFVDQFTINELVVKEAAADCMDGVSVSDISTFGVTSSTRRLINFKITDIRSLTADSTTVYYVVTADFDGASYSSLSSQLSQAVSDGTFNNYLNQYATASGAADLTGCTSNSVTTADLLGTGGNSNGLSTGAIAGIVVAIVSFFGFVISAIYYILVVQKQQQPPVLPTGAAPQPSESELVKNPSAPVVTAVPAVPTGDVKVISDEPNNPLHA